MNEARVTWTLRQQIARKTALPSLRVLTSWGGAEPVHGGVDEIPADGHGRRHADVDGDPPMAA